MCGLVVLKDISVRVNDASFVLQRNASLHYWSDAGHLVEGEMHERCRHPKRLDRKVGPALLGREYNTLENDLVVKLPSEEDHIRLDKAMQEDGDIGRGEIRTFSDSRDRASMSSRSSFLLIRIERFLLTDLSSDCAS